MKALTDSKFFRLLQENEPAPEELQHEYEQFAAQVFSLCSAASNDLEACHQTLVYTCVELSCLLPQIRKNALSYLEKAIELIDRLLEFVERQVVAKETGIHCPLTVKSAIRKLFDWTGEPIELVELLYALHEAGCLGKTMLKNLFENAGILFGVEIKNYSRLFWGAKARGGGRTKFLDKLKRALIKKIEKSDEKPSRK